MARGKNPIEAMQAAGRIRLRPILMTAVSTVAGTLPIVLGFGAGAESRRALGITTLGGMALSTFLTLFVIPVVYVLFSRLQAGWARGTHAGWKRLWRPQLAGEKTHGGGNGA